MQEKTNYLKIASHEARIGEVKKCVLLYSGGLDTSVMLKWIKDVYKCEVVALTLDIGQPTDDMDEIKAKALMLGAKEAYVLDCKDEYAKDYISKAIMANASYQGDYHLSTPVGRPLIAKKAVEIAIKVGADAIAHGCTGKGNDQVRIEATALCLKPDIKFIAPVREWGMGREEEIEYAHQHNIPVKQKKDVPYSWDENMWGITGEGGEIENPKAEPRLEKILQISNTPEKAPDEKAHVELEFKEGLPIKLNGESMKLAELIAKLNTLGGKHAIGYTILIEDRLVGLKVRGVYENPAAHIIINAHKDLEKIVSTREENEFKTLVDTKWAYLCYGAKWEEPLMEHLNAFILDMNQKVTGKVRLSLYKGRLDVLAVESPYSLLDPELATFERSAKFNQNSSASFTEIYSLAMKSASQAKLKNQ